MALNSQGKKNKPVVLDADYPGGNGDFYLYRTADNALLQPNAQGPSSVHYVLFPPAGVNDYDLHVIPQLLSGGTSTVRISITQDGKQLPTVDEKGATVVMPDEMKNLPNAQDTLVDIGIGLS